MPSGESTQPAPIQTDGGSCRFDSALVKTNIIQFINLPHHIHKPILYAVQDCWSKGIVHHGSPKSYPSSAIKTDQGEIETDVWEIQMKGVVWGSRGVQDGVA